MSCIQYGNKTIFFNVERSNRRKTVGIYIDPERGVIVRSPRFLRIDNIKEIVRKRARWIIAKQEFLKNHSHLLGSVKEFVSGEAFPYLGKQYRLKVVKSSTEKEEECKLVNGRFLVEVNRDLKGESVKRNVKKALIQWYVAHAEEKIAERIKLYSLQIGRWPERIEIKNHKRRWGSCSHNVVRFNWKIVMTPVTIVDYVIVHELCHLIYQHHSSQFWQKVQTIIPDYKKRRNTLKEYSFQLATFDE